MCEEFFNQGDKEKSLGMAVSTMTDRTTVNKNSMQIGFIEYVVCPLYESFVKLFPTLSVLLDNLLVNCREWSNRSIEEIKSQRKPGYDGEIQKLESRFSHLSERVNNVIKSVEPIAKDLDLARRREEEMGLVIENAMSTSTFGVPSVLSGSVNTGVLTDVIEE